MKGTSGDVSGSEPRPSGDHLLRAAPPTGRSGHRKQYFAAFAVNLALVASGASTGWSSSALARMSLSEAEKSWAGSLVALGAALGPWVGGCAADRLGRRATLLWGALPFLLGWAMLLPAENLLGLLYAARLILGLGVGITFTALPMYISEISQPEVRGALGTLLQLTCTVGVLLMYVVGPYVPYMVLAAVGATPAVLFLLVFYWFAESPYYLLNRNKEKEAEAALKTFRSDGEDVTKEILEIQETVQESRKNAGSFRDLVSTRGNVRALYLSLGLVTLQQFSGINAISFFCLDIFKKTSSSLDSSVSQIIFGIVMTVASFISPPLVDRLGRRILLISSAIGMCLPLIALGVYFQLSDSGDDVSNLGWLPITALVLYSIAYCPGFGPLPWVVLSELFPNNVKSIASSLTASVCWFLGFLISKFFADIAAALNNAVPFYFFGVCCVLAALFVFFLLPETKGRSLEEIQDMLNK